MRVIYAQQDYPSDSKGIFLAGPTLRARSTPCRNFSLDLHVSCTLCAGTMMETHDSWRVDAISIMRSLGFDGDLYVPEPKTGDFGELEDRSYDRQVIWEHDGLERSNVIMFWIPRSLDLLPGFTTNVEFGMHYRSGKCVLGYPSNAKKMKYISYLAHSVGMQVSSTLFDTCSSAVRKFSMK